MKETIMHATTIDAMTLTQAAGYAVQGMSPAEESDMPVFDVTVRRVTTEHCTVSVLANTADEAIRAANEEMPDDGWEITDCEWEGYDARECTESSGMEPA